MKKLIVLALFLALFSVSGCARQVNNNQAPGPTACTMEAKICPDGSAVGRTGANCDFAPCPATSLMYEDKDYGFSLEFPLSWQGYAASSSVIEYGHKIVFRHPQWTTETPREDLPILIYPLSQWQTWEKNNFEGYPTAAPFGPTERGRNNSYVFATAPRYNYDFQLGWEEVEDIIKTLKTISVSVSVPSVGIANPAASYCVAQGGKSVIVSNPDGSQGGNCILKSGKTCEEWAYFRKECQ